MLYEKRDAFSKTFYLMPLTTNSKAKINQQLKPVSLHLVDCLYRDFKNLLPSESDSIPSNLSFGDEK